MSSRIKFTVNHFNRSTTFTENRSNTHFRCIFLPVVPVVPFYWLVSFRTCSELISALPCRTTSNQSVWKKHQRCFFLQLFYNLHLTFLSVNSVPAGFDSRAAGVEFLRPSAGDLDVGHDRQGDGVRVTVLWRLSHSHSKLWRGARSSKQKLNKQTDFTPFLGISGLCTRDNFHLVVFWFFRLWLWSSPPPTATRNSLCIQNQQSKKSLLLFAAGNFTVVAFWIWLVDFWLWFLLRVTVIQAELNQQVTQVFFFLESSHIMS